MVLDEIRLWRYWILEILDYKDVGLQRCWMIKMLHYKNVVL